MNLPIVYYHPYAPWDTYGARQRYLMTAMSAHTRVVYLNPPSPSGKRLEVLRPAVRQISPTLFVVDNAFGFRASSLGRRIKSLAMGKESAWLHKLLREIGITRYAYWLSTPFPDLVCGMDCDNLIYDCIDPAFGLKDTAEYDRCEREVAQRARVVFCTAEILLERMQALVSSAYLLPNACSPEDYAPSKLASLALPPSLEGKPKPIIGYMGSVDSRVDTVLLTQTAGRLPAYTFAVVGRINADQKAKVRELRDLPNVVMPGAVSLEEGRAYTAAFDVGLIPFLPGYEGDAINPVKMYMYLLAGKPVVSTWIRECRHHAPYVLAARDAEDFSRAIKQASAQHSPAETTHRVEFALRNTWELRAQTAVELLSKLLV